MNPHLIAAEIVSKWDELSRDNVINREDFIAGLIQNALRPKDGEQTENNPLTP